MRGYCKMTRMKFSFEGMIAAKFGVEGPDVQRCALVCCSGRLPGSKVPSTITYFPGLGSVLERCVVISYSSREACTSVD